MGRVLAHFLAATALLGVVASEGNVVRPTPRSGSNSVTVVRADPISGLLTALGDITDVLTTGLQGLITTNPIGLVDSLVGPILSPHPRDPQRRGWEYFGCFDNSFPKNVKFLPTTLLAGLAGLTPQTCIRTCSASGRDYAAMIATACLCSGTAPDIGTGVGTSKCILKCVADAQSYCRGAIPPSISVFKRVVSTGSVPAPAHPINAVYSGCYDTNSLSTGAFVTIATAAAGMDGTKCTGICFAAGQTYTVAAIAGLTCYCSKNSLRTITKWRRRHQWGCFYGGAYLLDTILDGAQVGSALTDALTLTPKKCITSCIAANKGYTFVMTLKDVCFCNNKPPTADLRVPTQTLCNLPYPGSTSERCSGTGINALLGRNLINL
ncbi:hypothetical protein GQ44DRAFT_832578 [Phaeosphaeriaceae sp. PMI808]|nr:hypothetical protein GQ44DRAFT_832578 [Phaeosphaeriaceae sp. PMI808]